MKVIPVVLKSIINDFPKKIDKQERQCMSASINISSGIDRICQHFSLIFTYKLFMKLKIYFYNHDISPTLQFLNKQKSKIWDSIFLKIVRKLGNSDVDILREVSTILQRRLK